MTSSRRLVLGISTAGPVEVALSDDTTDIVRVGTGGALESLASFVDETLAAANATLNDVGLIGVCTGPGSFTGLRIGVAFARTLAQSLELPIIGVSSYDVASHDNASYPLISVARGKKDYYYARVLLASDAEPCFVQGSRELIGQVRGNLSTDGVEATIVGTDFTDRPAGDTARAVLHLARAAFDRGLDARWQSIGIDYGQRPNAVLNWERRLKERPTN